MKSECCIKAVFQNPHIRAYMPKAPPVSMMPSRDGPYEKNGGGAVIRDSICSQCKRPALGEMVELVCGHAFHLDCFQTMLSVTGSCGTCWVNCKHAVNPDCFETAAANICGMCWERLGEAPPKATVRRYFDAQK